MTNSEILFLSSNEITSILTMQDCIDAMRSAFINFSQGKSIVPQRISLNLSKDNDEALFMPAFENESDFASLKIVSVFKNNPQINLPKIQALIILIDAKTGSTLSIMDGEYITAMRTGAVSGLATDLLAKRDSQTAAIIGTSVQAVTQLEAIDCVRELRKVFIFGLTLKDAEKFVNQNKKKYSFELIPAENKSLLNECDIICTATSSLTPVFEDINIKEGSHINSIGSYKPNMCEIPEGTILRSKLVADSISACLNEAGDIIQPINKGSITQDHIYAELGEIASGVKSGRKNEEEITVFKSVGIAIQDLAVSSYVYKKAMKMKLGKKISI